MKSILPFRPIEAVRAISPSVEEKEEGKIESARDALPRAAGTSSPDQETEEAIENKVGEAFEKGWGVLVWNDPINTMSYVTFIFQKILKMDRATAERHMLEVHTKGKSMVARETRERAELIVPQIQAYGVKATLEHL